MEPLDAAGLPISVPLLTFCATLEIFGLFRFATFLRGLFKGRQPSGSS